MKSKSSNPLDLNNFPDDQSKDGRPTIAEGSSSSGHRKKMSCGKDGKGEKGKIYECRFCSLTFGKSQALGGHMNRHRQERETETLNRARQIVSESLAAQGAPRLGAQPIVPGCLHQTGHMGDPTIPYRPVHPARMFPVSPSAVVPPPPPPYMHPSQIVSHPSHDYYLGHVLASNSQCGYPNPDSNYTCIGAPVRPGFPPGASGIGSTRLGSDSGARDGSLRSSQEGGSSWGSGSTHRRLHEF